MTQDELRKEFEEWTKPMALDMSMILDGWGNRKYLHSHINSMFEGYQSAARKRDAVILRLTDCLKKANANHEEFERKWYLAEHKNEDQAAGIAALKAELEAAKKDVQKLTALEVSGVDNWSGYDSAMDILYAMKSGK